MNASVFLYFFLTALAAVFSFPTIDDFKSEDLHLKVKQDTNDSILEVFNEKEPQNAGTRFRRATCDLFSLFNKWVSFDQALCAAHCLAMKKNYKGGYCKDGVCHCRK